MLHFASPATGPCTIESMRVLAVLLPCLALGCGSTITLTTATGDAGGAADAPAVTDAAVPSGDALVAGDAGPSADAPSGPDAGPAVDAPPATDAPVTNDLPAPTDVPTPLDVPARPDVPVFADVPAVGDAPVPADASTFPLIGRWRLTRVDAVSSAGRTITFTDVTTPFVDDTGTTQPARANGILEVRADRMALSETTLISEHAYVYAGGYSTNGFGLAGLLDEAGGRFTPTGATTSLILQRNTDGTVTLLGDALATTRFTFTRADTPVTVDQISAVGLAMSDTPPGPVSNLRVALFWDLAGPGAFVETNGVALTVAGRFASFPLVLAAPPADAQRVRIGTASVALARIIVYVDTDGSRTFDRTIDHGAAISPIGIAWRDATPLGTDATATPVRDLRPGYQYVLVHNDSSVGGPAVTPFDNTHPVSPDVPIYITGTAPMSFNDVL